MIQQWTLTAHELRSGGFTYMEVDKAEMYMNKFLLKTTNKIRHFTLIGQAFSTLPLHIKMRGTKHKDYYLKHCRLLGHGYSTLPIHGTEN